MTRFPYMLPEYFMVFLFLCLTVWILSKLKPIDQSGYVCWGEYAKCESGAERKFFKELARINLYAMCQLRVGERMRSDFYIPRYNLYVEIDGIHHQLPEQQERDRRKDKIIRESGANVVRIPADLVHKNPEEAVLMMLRASYLNEEQKDGEPVGQGG